MHGFTAGWADGSYDVSLAYDGERAVGVLVDFVPASDPETAAYGGARHERLAHADTVDALSDVV